MNKFRLLILIPIITIWTSLIFAQSSRFELIAKQGQQQLKVEQFNDAQQLFKRGYSIARKAGDEEWNARFLFYLGNAYLVEANKDSTLDSVAENKLAKNAADVYRRVVKLRPESGSAKVNLARALALMGDIKGADLWYQQAIAKNDQKQLQFRQQYAAFLTKHNPKEAVEQLRAIILEQPKNIKAHRMLMQLFESPKYVAQLPKYLSEQVKIGEVLRAQNVAIRFLLDPSLSSRIYNDLVIVLATSLAQQHIDPKEFAQSDTAVALKQIAEAQPHLGDCMQELSLTLSKGRATKYQWWTENTRRSSALSALLRSVAEYYDQADQPQRAELVYRQAVELRGARDPKAITDLVGFYSKRGNLAKINEISKTYEFQLFERKGQAYSSGNVEAIYDYHRTLASIYSFQASKTGDWGSSSKVNSAAFQLERAYSTAQKSKKIIPDVNLVNDLAASFEAKGKNTRANAVRLDSAANYKFIGNATAATAVLGTVKQSNLSTVQRQQYLRVKTTPVNPKVIDTLKVDRPSLTAPNVSPSPSGAKFKVSNSKQYQVLKPSIKAASPLVEKQLVVPKVVKKTEPIKLKQTTQVYKTQSIVPKTLRVPTKTQSKDDNDG